MTDRPNEPWKLTLGEIWSAITGGRKPIAVLLVLVIFVLPGAYGLLTFYWNALKSAQALLVGATSIMSPDEENARNEWIAVVSYWPSEKEARDAAATFSALYQKYETTFRDLQGYPVWRDDIIIVRDPQKAGRWLVGIDMYHGPSSEPVVSAELARVARLGGNDPEAQNTYQRLFVGSRALCYSQKTFEATYGTLDPEPKAKLDVQGRPHSPCAAEA